MSGWAIVALVAIVMSGLVKMYQAKYGVVTDRTGAENRAPAPLDDAALRELQELRERVKVLERITVEQRESVELTKQIEALKDK